MSLASPCINVCRMHTATGWCEGCGRTLDEIARWTRLDEAGRARVWQLLPQRLLELQRLRAAQQPAP